MFGVSRMTMVRHEHCVARKLLGVEISIDSWRTWSGSSMSGVGEDLETRRMESRTAVRSETIIHDDATSLVQYNRSTTKEQQLY